MPRYGGQHAHLTEEERQQFEVKVVAHQLDPCASRSNVYVQ